LLEKNPKKAFTAREICDILEIDEEREVYELLKQISKILKKKKRIIEFTQPVCRKCGFVMKKMNVSRCPKCKSQWIEPPRFRIKEI